MRSPATARSASATAGSLPYLAARRVTSGSLEPLPAFATRVDRDYVAAKHAAEQVAHDPVIAFSWPFGAYGADGRDERPRDRRDQPSPRTPAVRARVQRRRPGHATRSPTARAIRSGSAACASIRPSLHAPCSTASSWRSPRPRGRCRPMRRLILAARDPGRDRRAAPRWRSRPTGLPRGPSDCPPHAHDPLQVIAFTEARPTSAARGSLSAHLASLDAISPAWLSLGPEGTIAYRDSDAFSRSLATRGAAILPVLNDPQQRISRLLADPPMRRRTALRLGVILRALGAQGIVLDLGRIDPSERLALPAFVAGPARAAARDIARPDRRPADQRCRLPQSGGRATTCATSRGPRRWSCAPGAGRHMRARRIRSPRWAGSSAPCATRSRTHRAPA